MSVADTDWTDNAVLRLQRWYGLDEVTATMTVGVVIGSSAFCAVTLLVLCARQAARRQRQACLQNLLGGSTVADDKASMSGSGGGKAAPSRAGGGATHGPATKKGTRTVEENGGEEGDDAELSEGHAGGYRSDSASDDDGEGARVDKLAQKNSRKARGL